MVKKTNYVPGKGDVVWLDFNQQAGHEQSGRRPALVVSPETYNLRSHLMLCCPITSQVKGYPFEVAVEGASKVKGVILSDQVKSLDWETRRAEKIGKVPAAVLQEVIDKIEAILEG